jgi:phosphatidylinositol alpha-1,6-mannosyltransferase
MSLEAGNGGIARVARLIARVLNEELLAGEIGRAAVVSFSDTVSPHDLSLPIALARGSKIRFALWSMHACLESHAFIYDGPQLAQVHRLPVLSRKPFLAVLNGIEIWDQAKPSYVRISRQARLLVSNSHYTLNRAEHIHGRLPQARVCWLATETDSPPAIECSGGQPQVLIVGRIDPRENKGHRDLVRCWPRVVQAVPEATLQIVGRGEGLAELQELVRRSSVADRIVFAGFVPEVELDRLYAQSAVFCMPSRQEGFGLVYVEAMRHGLPVIASVHDAAPEIVLDGQTGYTVDLDKPDELPERIIRLLRDPDHARQLGECGRQRWGAHFRYSAFCERFRPLLREFLSRA